MFHFCITILTLTSLIAAQKFQLYLLANTFENAKFNNYGLSPVYQNGTDFEGPILLLGSQSHIFTYDNSTQYLTYTHNQKTYYLNILQNYIVGVNSTSTVELNDVQSSNKFVMNVDGTLWVTAANNNLFYTFPNQVEIFNSKSYLSVYLMQNTVQHLNTQQFTIVYRRIDNSTSPITGSANIATGDIGSVSLNVTLSPNSTVNGSAVNGSASPHPSDASGTPKPDASKNDASQVGVQNIKYFFAFLVVVFSTMM